MLNSNIQRLPSTNIQGGFSEQSLTKNLLDANLAEFRKPLSVYGALLIVPKLIMTLVQIVLRWDLDESLYRIHFL